MDDRQIDRQTELFSNQKCSVCNGFGTLGYKKAKCHACGGRGLIVIDNNTGKPVDDRKKDEKQTRQY